MKVMLKFSRVAKINFSLVCPNCCLMKRGKQCLYMCVRKGVWVCVCVYVYLCLYVCGCVWLSLYVFIFLLYVCVYVSSLHVWMLILYVWLYVSSLYVCVCFFSMNVCTSVSECGSYMQGSILSAFSWDKR